MKASKPMSAFFKENLQAPLKNVQWSWGAENEKGVYLRVWLDENVESSCLICMNDAKDSRLGQSERKKHIETIQQGKPGYVVQITDGEETLDGKWKIRAYQECIYRIKEIHQDSKGDIYAKVDFNTPIYPEFIGKEIDIDSIKSAAKKNKTAYELLVKAIEKFNWQPTKVCPDNEIISLISNDGKQFASIYISQGTWIRG